MGNTMRTVEIDWTAVDRSNPVYMIVKDERTVEIEYKRATLHLVGDDSKDRTDRARRAIAGWASDANREALPVRVYNAHQSPPTLTLLICVAETEDFIKDTEADEDEVQAAEKAFREWKAANNLNKRPRARRSGSRAAPAPQERKDSVREAIFGSAEDDADPEALNEGAVEPDTPESGPVSVVAVDEEPEVEPVVSAQRTTDNGFSDVEDMSAFDTPALTDFSKPVTVEETKHARPGRTARNRAQLTDSPFATDDLMAEGKHDEKAKLGWRGSVNQLFGLHLSPDAHELARRESIAEIVRGWSGTKRVAVINDKGGSGKTPVSLMLGAAVARNISFPVAVFDNNESAGLAKERVELVGQHDLDAKDLAEFAAVSTDMWNSDIEAFMYRHAEDRYNLLASFHPSLESPPLSRSEINEVYRALAQFYPLVITDSGNTWTAENWLAMIQRTDQLVVPMVTSPDRFKRAQDLLTTLHGFGDSYAELARNAVIVISQWQPGDKATAQRYADLWEGKVREVVMIPYDAHLGSHNLRFDRLRPRTQDQFLELGGAVTRGLRGEVRE